MTIAQRFADTPVLIEAGAANWLASSLQSIDAHMALTQEKMAAADEDFWDPESWRAHYRPYVVQNGVLQIPVKGLLLNGFPYALGSLATGYEYIEAAYVRGSADPDVSKIAFVIDSGGGMVAGNFDMVDRMYAAKATHGKPVASIVAEHAYSAAYSIASLADTIYVPRTGGVGSIGVVTSHVDMSGYLDKMGIKVTFIHAGKHKVEGNPYSPLSEDAQARIQARVDRMYKIFVQTVARNRGMDEKAVRDTEALTFSAEEAVELGLADEILSAEDAFSAFSRGNSSEMGETVMSKPTAAAPQTAAETPVDEAAVRTEGATAERARVKSILTCEEAEGRKDMAEHLAFNTNLSAEDAAAMLAVAPKAAAPVAQPEQPQPSAAAAFNAAMAHGNPEVGAEADAADPEPDQITTILGDWKAQTGRGQNTH